MFDDVYYLAWAQKFFAIAKFDLASSGTLAVQANELLDDDVSNGWPARLHDPSLLGDFARVVAERYQVPREEVVPALGATGGVWTACASVLRPGDTVVVEAPAYEPLWRVPQALGARVARFAHFDLADLKRQLVAERPRLVIVSHLHNPSGKDVGHDALREAARLCAKHDAYILIDEVYGEFASSGSNSARKLGDNVIAVSSLTKRWGVGWARTGWIIAPPEVAQRAAARTRLETGYVGVPLAAVGLAAFKKLDALSERADALAAGKREIVAAWVKQHPGLVFNPEPRAIFGLIQVTQNVENLRERIERACHNTGVLVVPGEFFEMPNAFRICWAKSQETLSEGLKALSQQLFLSD